MKVPRSRSAVNAGRDAEAERSEATVDPPPTTGTGRTILQNSLVMLGSQATTWILSACVVIVVPRLLGPDAIGRYTVAVAVWAVASVFIAAGSTMTVTLETARDSTSVGATIATALRLRAVTVPISWIVVISFFAALGYPFEVAALAVVVGVVTTLNAATDVGASALVGLERIPVVARAEVASRFAYAVAVIGVVLLTRNLYAAAAMGATTPIVRGVILVRSLKGAMSGRHRASWTDVRAMARRSTPYLVAGIALTVYGQVDTVTISILAEERQVGWYAAATAVFATLMFAPSILMTSLLPALTKAHARSEEEATTLLGRAFDTLVLIAVPIGVATTICAPSGMRLLLGPEFAPAGDVLAVLGVVLLFTYFAILLGAYAYATGRQHFWNGVIGAAILLSVPLDLVLVPWTQRRYGNGAIGGALAYVVTEMLMVIAGIVCLAPQLLSIQRCTRVLLCTFGGGVMVLVGWPLRSQFVVVPGLASLAAYAVVILVLRVPNEAEWNGVRSLVANARSRLRPGRNSRTIDPGQPA